MPYLCETGRLPPLNTRSAKRVLEDYFDCGPYLEAEFAVKAKTAMLETFQDTNENSGAIAYIRQYRALGLGHAVRCARRLTGDEPFPVILPADVIAALNKDFCRR